MSNIICQWLIDIYILFYVGWAASMAPILFHVVKRYFTRVFKGLWQGHFPKYLQAANHRLHLSHRKLRDGAFVFDTSSDKNSSTIYHGRKQIVRPSPAVHPLRGHLRFGRGQSCPRFCVQALKKIILPINLIWIRITVLAPSVWQHQLLFDYC